MGLSHRTRHLHARQDEQDGYYPLKCQSEVLHVNGVEVEEQPVCRYKSNSTTSSTRVREKF